jgi:hypothetical protein
MAKCIYVCSREKLHTSVGNQLSDICKSISPDNLIISGPKIVTGGNFAYGIMNPNSTISEINSSLMLGQVLNKEADWHTPLQDFPDGSYAIFRNGEQYFEIVTDPVASRTIWYFMDEGMFVASTSQRAIIMYLGSFEFNEEIIPWMLSTGNLGPLNSWDKRIKMVPPDSSVILDKVSWTLSYRSNPIEFIQNKLTDEQHEIQLREALEATFKSLSLDYTKWVIPLSGGYDSRGIVCSLIKAEQKEERLRTITWGLKSALKVKDNDAYVAKELAYKLNISNKYYTNDPSTEPADEIINRFLMVGEGRIGNISQYLDGFRMWATIYKDGIEGIIRGDEGFGCNPYSSELAVRINQSCSLCTDFSNLKDYRKYGFPEQKLPADLIRKKHETLSQWCDRLFHQYTLSTEFPALSDLKLSYVEVINPLLSRKILQKVRQLPDHLRTGKALFKKIVTSLSPEINYAKSATSSSLAEILKQGNIVKIMRSDLSSELAQKLFSDEFLDFVLKGLSTKEKKDSPEFQSSLPTSLIGRIVPRFIKEALRKMIISPRVDGNVLAFRVLLIIRMNRMLYSDKMVIHK